MKRRKCNTSQLAGPSDVLRRNIGLDPGEGLAFSKDLLIIGTTLEEFLGIWINKVMVGLMGG